MRRRFTFYAADWTIGDSLEIREYARCKIVLCSAAEALLLWILKEFKFEQLGEAERHVSWSSGDS